MAVGKGDPAPDFTLPGAEDGELKDYSLSDFRGRPVVLVFYPGDNTPVCTRQLNTYTADIDEWPERAVLEAHRPLLVDV